MNIRFCGAADGVTGSCHLVTTDHYKFLLDCGMFQGNKKNEARNRLPFPFDPAELDFVILSHAHVDHCGRLPLLVKQGFRGYIYCTDATADLAEIILRDSAYIQERDTEYRNKKNKRGGGWTEPPIYTVNEAIETLKYLHPVLYQTQKEVAEGITIRFQEAGHILGSSSVEIWIEEKDENGNDTRTKMVFSGDIGTFNRPILRDPKYIDEADVVIMETTYGNRPLETRRDNLEELSDIIVKTVKRGGTVVIPAFSVGRTQELLYDIKSLFEKDKVFAEAMSGRKVYVDSPMAETATEIYKKNAQVYDEESRAMLLHGENPLSFEGLVFTRDLFDSQMLNKNKDPKVIISASGMCDAGRIKHHLKHNLWDARNSVVFVGYQAEGTLGRYIADGTEDVKIFGEMVHVRAEIYDLKGFSGHADMEGLVNWLAAIRPAPKAVFLVHGEADSKKDFAKLVKTRLGINAIPVLEECSVEIAEEFSVKKGLRSEEDARLEQIMDMRSRLADIHRNLEHILYVTQLSADDSTTEERIEDINEIILQLEKDTLNLSSVVTDYDVNNRRLKSFADEGEKAVEKPLEEEAPGTENAAIL